MDLLDTIFNFAKPKEVQGVSWNEGEKAIANASNYEPPSLLSNSDIEILFGKETD